MIREVVQCLHSTPWGLSLQLHDCGATDRASPLQVMQIEQEIERLRQAKGNRLMNFGAQGAVNLANAIKKHVRQFHRKPVGP